jgi:DNA end-binding protein Ku
MAKKPVKAVTPRVRRPAWTGFLRFGLVTIPVRAFPAKSDKADITLHWLHATCHNRIRYQKMCPVHGEVQQSEIVSGYQYGKKDYIVIDPDELKELHPQKVDTIDVTSTIAPTTIDDIYFTDSTYYLLPDGDAGTRPYTVFQEALAKENRYGIAEAVLFRREHLLVVRPIDKLLIFTLLTYPDRVKDVSQFENQLPESKSSARELDMAKTLISQLSNEDFDISTYKDRYAEDLEKLIDAKAKGHRIEVPQEKETPAPLDFMDALKKSLQRGMKSERNGHSPKPRAHRRKAS